MNSLLILIPVTLLIVLLAAAVFFWAVNHQQFDDLDSPGFVPLLEEPPQGGAGPDMPGATRRRHPEFPVSDAAGRTPSTGLPAHIRSRNPGFPGRATIPSPLISNPESRTTRSIS